MFETSLFSTAALLDATLTVVELQETELRAEETQSALTPEQDAALAEACEQFDGLIEQHLEEGRSDVLMDALETLQVADRHTACQFLESAIELNATRYIDDEGNRWELKLVPLVVSRETADDLMPSTLCQTLAKAISSHYAQREYAKVTVGSRLWSAEDIYALHYHEVYALNHADNHGVRHLVSHSLHQYNDRVWHPVLRFMLVHTVTAPALALNADDRELDEDFAPVSDFENNPPAEQKTHVESSQELTKELAHQLAVLFGSPMVCGSLNNIYEARKEGMLIYSHKVAHTSINRQLTKKGVRPQRLILTCHSRDPDVPEAVVDQLRVALVDERGQLLAGHVLECSDWLGAAESMDLVALIGEWAHLDSINQVREVFALDENELEPYFCTGNMWEKLANGAPRLEQAQFT
jgi:hypothetical protein